MRVATFNLLHGMSVADATGAGAIDDERLAAAVRLLDADVIGLQEADAFQPRSGHHHQVRDVAEALDAEHYRFLPTVIGTPGPGGTFRAASDDDDPHDRSLTMYGIGLASRFPVVRWHHVRMNPARIALPLLVPGENGARFLKVPDEPRAALAAVIETPHGLTTVACVHLSFVPGVNVGQLRRVRAFLTGLPQPQILLGDFNLPGRIPAKTARMTSLVAQPTYPVFAPRVQFDHILSSGYVAHRTQVHRLLVSDHCAVTADVRRIDADS